jgi:DNA-binding transcriptional LysR family regulator
MCFFWKEVNERFKAQGIAPKTVMQAENDEFVLSLVAENLGVSIMTDRITPYEVRLILIKDFKIDQYIGFLRCQK